MERRDANLLERVEFGVVWALGALPRRLQRALAGRPREIDGQVLEPDIQMILRLLDLVPGSSFEQLPVPEARRQVNREAVAFGGKQRVAMREVEDLSLPGPAGTIGARLFVPRGVADPSPLLVWFHGGGFVLGGQDTYEAPCRFLAREAGVRVLAVDYRLAPEHRFPAAVEDAYATLRFAAREAERLGADPARIGVGGDSAGGNLSAVASLLARDGGPRLAFQLLVYPWLDLSRKSRSCELFSDGFFLTERQLDWYRSHYLGTAQTEDWMSAGAASARDWRASPLLADGLFGLARAHIALAGFDPLRDEGIAYARRLKEAGVPVTVRMNEGLPHAFINAPSVGRACPAATREVAAALRLGMYGGP